MQRTLIVALVLSGFAASAGDAAAQAIKVVQKPAPQAGPDDTVVYDTWTMSWGLRGDSGYPLGFRTFNTLAEAQAAAQAAIASTSGNGEWAITHVLIEGEASLRSRKGPTLPSEDKIEKDTLGGLGDDLQKSLTKILKEDVESLFKKKNQEVKDSFRRAKEAKELLVRNVNKIADDDFKKVNGLIAGYNGLKDRYAGEQINPQYFAALPRMTPVSAGDVKRQQDNWKKAQQSDDELKNEKRALDEERARLENERQQLIDQGRALDRAEASAGDATGLAGSEWEIPKDPDGTFGSRIFGLRIIEFEADGSLTARYNVEASRFKGKWRALGGNSYEVTLRGGTYTVTISGNQFSVSNVALNKRKGGTPDPAAQAKLDELAKQKGQRGAGVADYRRDLAKYQERLAAYEQNVAAQKAHLRQWQQDQYSTPANLEPLGVR